MSANAFAYLPETGSMPASADTTDADALALLGIPRHDDDTAFEHVRRGRPTSVFDRWAEALGSVQRGRGGIAAFAPTTRSRRRRAHPPRLSATESDRIYRIADVLAEALRLFEGDLDAAREWLTEPAKALGGSPPLERLEAEVGATEVRRLIERLEHGILC
ncbi:antitoxin Xre/MbcA/ParS toxin-binding domain-containing protein [Thiohalocapsa sp.]|uniref:antitoxin Xre/MbcA/ParS toxin-binding domain-containing protein n=1 Tax=Thiohalocapsa sp. TaxID=2497641 RepID=UPI0025D3928D|nr:antitoxin Xre/MbcA/ParS toxin-binding domain-containing protein [Thiohalocapsa sp.]